MLVLNTGQVPWEVARQLETIYRPLLNSIENTVGEKIRFLSRDDGPRRKLGPNDYETEDLVELLLIFSSRKREINLKDQLAQDFARLDMIESSSHADFLEYFSRTIILLSELNTAVSAFIATDEQRQSLQRFANGRDLFSAFPSKAGFVAAMSVYLFNSPGFPTDWSAVPEKFKRVERELTRLIASLNKAPTPMEKGEILSFDDLEERISKHKVGATQVGRFEREYFEAAFEVLFKRIEEISNFRPCWVAYG